MEKRGVQVIALSNAHLTPDALSHAFDVLLQTADITTGVFMTGTDTDVGKTWVGCHFIRYLRTQGWDVAPRKPVESGWTEAIKTSDAWQLADAADKQDQLDIICPNRFNAPVSPHRAAQLEDKILSVQQLKQHCLAHYQPHQLLYIEGAGGFYSPLCEDGLNADLCGALNVPIILVAADKLGCINHVLLTVAAIEQRGLKLLGVILNTIPPFSTTHQQNNTTDLQGYLDCPVISTDPKYSG